MDGSVADLSAYEQGKRLAADFDKHGAVKAAGIISPQLLEKCRTCFDWTLDNPGPMAVKVFEGTPDETFVDNSNPAAQEMYKTLVSDGPFADFLAGLWGSENVWFFAEEVFVKKGGKTGRSPWHQDTAYLPWEGGHFANFWISFDPVPLENALEIARGTHKGQQYDGSSYDDPDDHSKPLWDNGVWPRLPDIEAERAQDPGSWETVSWEVSPGDAIILHPHSLHGGAPLSPEHPQRRTLVLRFFGDDAKFRHFPGQTVAHDDDEFHATDFGLELLEGLPKLNDGDPFRAPKFKQLR